MEGLTLFETRAQTFYCRLKESMNRDTTVKSSRQMRETRDSQRMAVLVRALPFALFIALLAVRGALAPAMEVASAPDLRWIYALQVAVAAVPLFLWRLHYGELSEVPRSPGSWAISVVTGVAIFLLWIAPLPGWTRVGSPVATFVPLDVHGAIRWDLVAVRIAGAVLVVPVMEELFWRSFLMRWIDRRDFLGLSPDRASSFALLASSAVFALAHDLWFAGFVAGLAYAQLYRRLDNLWYAVGAHATTNFALAMWVLTRGAWQYW
jgi:CAAX prenyl protease-like protein